MGCFSFMCKSCGKPILSTPKPDKVILFLLRKGKVTQKLEGIYDGYGRIIKPDGHVTDWRDNWNNIVDLMFNDNPGDGIAAFHKRCYNDIEPITKSEDDPNQGWGE